MFWGSMAEKWKIHLDSPCEREQAVQSNNSLWAEIFRAKYLNSTDILGCLPRGYNSDTCKGILNSFNLVQDGVCMACGKWAKD